jgi:hypothetical protein
LYTLQTCATILQCGGACLRLPVGSYRLECDRITDNSCHCWRGKRIGYLHNANTSTEHNAVAVATDVANAVYGAS